MLSDYRQHATALAAQLPFANVLAPGSAPQAQAWLARHAPGAVTWSIESHMGFWEYPSEFNRRLLTFLRSADATARSTS
jgi:pimeloyl-ACP methyl ester carboxylesterase